MKLFGTSEGNLDPIYCNVRNSVGAMSTRVRSDIEALWCRFQPFADADFLKRFSLETQQRYWEMHLACALIDMGFELVTKCNTAGPDVCGVRNGLRIWVEATAPTRGDEGSPDHVPELVPINRGGVARLVPEREILLRFASAISAKKRKIDKYISDGLVPSNEPLIIAITGARLDNFPFDGFAIPYIVKAVFPIGQQYAVFSRDPLEIVRTGHQYRPTISKSGGSSVSVQCFVDDEYREISGVLFRARGIGATDELLGCDYIFVHNPLTTRKIAHGAFPRGREFWAERVGDNFELREKRHDNRDMRD